MKEWCTPSLTTKAGIEFGFSESVSFPTIDNSMCNRGNGSNAGQGIRMTILSERIDFATEGRMDEIWHETSLRYDTESRKFFVEYTMTNDDIYKGTGMTCETKAYQIDEYKGYGVQNIPQAKRSLLEKAGHE